MKILLLILSVYIPAFLFWSIAIMALVLKFGDKGRDKQGEIWHEQDGK